MNDMLDDPVTRLDEAQSWKLLSENSLGRLALILGGRPEVFPVNYYAADGRILMRTAQGTKLFGVTVHSEVAFEIDGHTDTDAWSVIAHGSAHLLETEAAITKAAASPLHPWLPTYKGNYIEITVSEITGRHFVLGEEPPAPLEP